MIDADDEQVKYVLQPNFGIVPSLTDCGIKQVNTDDDEFLALKGAWLQLSHKKIANIYANGTSIVFKFKDANIPITSEPMGLPKYIGPEKLDHQNRESLIPEIVSGLYINLNSQRARFSIRITRLISQIQLSRGWVVCLSILTVRERCCPERPRSSRAIC
jgi:hypothetical protein